MRLGTATKGSVRGEKFIISECSLYTISIYKPHVRQSAIYASSGGCRLRNTSATLNLRPRDGKVFRDLCGWRARGDMTSHGDGVDRLAGGPWRAVRGVWIGLRGYSGGCRGARLSNRRVTLCGELRRQSREHPSLRVSGGRAENTRTLCKEKGRERPSLMLSGGRTENARALDGSGGREHPSLPWMDLKAENARAFEVSEIKSREDPYSFERKDQDSCSREHPY